MEALGSIAARVVEKVARGEPVIERSVPTSREAWLDLRKATIGASEAAALLGVHPYFTAYELFAHKTGLLEHDPTETPAMRRGRLLEDDALQVIAEDHPDWQLIPNPIPGGFHYRDMSVRLSSTPDCFVRIPGREGRGAIQVKSLERSVFRKTWRQEDGSIEPPLSVAVQATIDAKLSDCTYAFAAPFVVGHGVEAPLVEVPIIPALWERVRTEVAAFWRGVADNLPPDPDFTRDGDLIAAIYGSGNGGAVDLSAENQLPEILAEDAQLREAAAEIKQRREAIRAEVLHKLAGSEIGTLPGWHITNRSQTRKSYTVKETTFSVLRIKQSEVA